MTDLAEFEFHQETYVFYSFEYAINNVVARAEKTGQHMYLYKVGLVWIASNNPKPRSEEPPRGIIVDGLFVPNHAMFGNKNIGAMWKNQNRRAREDKEL